MAYHCVYALFEEHVPSHLNRASEVLLDEFGPAWNVRPQTRSDLEPAHITVMYGPEAKEGCAEAKDEADARALLGGLDLNKLKRGDFWDRLEFRGVSHFDRRPKDQKTNHCLFWLFR